jgi:deoxyribodipyrimidine photo-lyase
VVRRGPVAATARRLARECGAGAVVWGAGYDAESARIDRELQSAIEERGLHATIVHDAPAVPPEETSAARSAGGSGYRSLAPYLAVWSSAPRPVIEARVVFAEAALPSEPLPEPGHFGAASEATPEASEAAARATLEAFLDGRGLQYATSRNVPSAAGTSRLSAHLSFGTIAARTVLRRVDERAADPFLLAEERLALRAFARSLARRDFFLQLSWFFEQDDAALQPKMRGFTFGRSHPALDAWIEGRTGYPLVDAGMRQLRATGWMHPLARLVAASFLCFDLGVDWRVGRDAWDRWLVEDDPALATCNWQWIAGVGADLAAYPRIYNPQKQARRFDPDAAYVREWLPELAGLPASDVFEPVARGSRPQLMLPLFDGNAYSAPVVDHATAARSFLRRYVDFTRADVRLERRDLGDD